MEEKPWLKFYDAEVPHTLAPYPECTLVDVVADSARQRPEHPAFWFQGATLRYGEMERLATVFAEALRKTGVKKGDRVAFVLPNSPQIILAFLGTWKAGAIAVPLNPLYTERELELSFRESAAETVVVLTPFYHKVKGVQPRTRIRTVIATNIKAFLPPVKKFLFTYVKEKKEGHRASLQSGDFWMEALIKGQAGDAADLPQPRPSDPAILLFSGGTTGTPKAAISTHQALYISGAQFHAWIQGLAQDWKETTMLNLPLFHTYAISAILACGLVGHYTLALVPNPRDLDDLLATIQKVRPGALSGVPTLYTALVNHPKVVSKQVDLTSLKGCGSGAASLLAETKQRFETITGARIFEGYGLTETNAAATTTPIRGVYKPNSAGIPLPDVDVRIADVETGLEDLPAGQVGEILIHGPQLMQGYWNKPEETAGILRDGWLYTGDIGYQDEDGYLFIVDRKKDLIKPGGFQVWPREVEEVIATHPAVAEVCVGSTLDAYSGEAVKAWVVLQPGKQLSEAELKAFCRENLTGYKVPKVIEFRQSLPKSAVGKILRRELVMEDRHL